MGLLPVVARKSVKGSVFLFTIYSILTLLGTTMIVPFMITLSSSTTNNYDYERFRPIPRYFYSQNDRYVKGLVSFFNEFRSANSMMHAYFPDMPSYWSSWNAIGRDVEGSEAFAQKYIDEYNNNPERSRTLAAEYCEFMEYYSVSDMVVTVNMPQGISFIRQYYFAEMYRKDPNFGKLSRSEQNEKALQLLNDTWKIPFQTFYSISFYNEQWAPMDFQGYFPNPENPKYRDFMNLKDAYRAQVYTPGVKSKFLAFLKKKNYSYDNELLVFPVMPDSPEPLQKLWAEFSRVVAPASPCIPYALRTTWYKFLASDSSRRILNLPGTVNFTIENYNQIVGTSYKTLEETPFPLPDELKKGKMAELWNVFVRDNWPLRLTVLSVTDETQKMFSDFLKKELKYLRIANELFGTEAKDWNDFKLPAFPPEGNNIFQRNFRGAWKNFATSIDLKLRTVSSSEIAYQKFLIRKYGSLEKINEVHGRSSRHIEEYFPPFAVAYTQTFLNNELAFTCVPIGENFRIIADYLLLNSGAIGVTVLLVVLALLCTLTVNPFAAYAMSRFRMRGKEMILLFMLATMAFPAMVSAIPAYLLMRDLGLLNTFAALLLPGIANGMGIFILKGFFDSLPAELFEAATIDGANEMQIFLNVAMPLVKPILAINCLGAFLGAYNGWEWALIICQDKSMWTIAVWMYQANMWWSGLPWVVSAGFILISIPIMIVFLSCQKIILRGIIIPSMK